MKGYEKVKELIEGELEDFGHFEIGELKIDKGYELEEDCEHYEIDIVCGYEKKVKTLYFQYDRKKDEIGIELSPESNAYETITTYDWRVKYFWMALLEW